MNFIEIKVNATLMWSIREGFMNKLNHSKSTCLPLNTFVSEFVFKSVSRSILKPFDHFLGKIQRDNNGHVSDGASVGVSNWKGCH